MPVFLVNLFSWLARTPMGQLFISYIGNKLVGLVKDYLAKREKKKQIREDVQKKLQPLKDAKTAQEIDDAISDALDDL